MQHHGCPQLRHRCLFLFPPQAHPPTIAGQLQLAGPLHLREHDFDLARALADLSECPGNRLVPVDLGGTEDDQASVGGKAVGGTRNVPGIQRRHESLTGGPGRVQRQTGGDCPPHFPRRLPKTSSTFAPCAKTLPAAGLEALTASGPGFLPLRGLGRCTLPSEQWAAARAERAAAMLLAASLGTVQWVICGGGVSAGPSGSAAKAATTARSAPSTQSRQGPLPTQPSPLKPVKAEPAAAVALRVMASPSGKEGRHGAPLQCPGPLPMPAFAVATS